MYVLLIYRHCFVILSTEVRKWPPKTGRRKSPISENWPSFGRLDGRLAKSLGGNNWSRSVTFTKAHETRWNLQEILPNTWRHNIFDSYLGCWGCILAVNLLNYLETTMSKQHSNTTRHSLSMNVPAADPYSKIYRAPIPGWVVLSILFTSR